MAGTITTDFTTIDAAGVALTSINLLIIWP